MLCTATVRKLAPVEALFAGLATTVAYTVVVEGMLDTAALSQAFDAARRAHPVFAGRVVGTGDGYHLVVEGRGLPPIRVRKGTARHPITRILDAATELAGLEVVVGAGDHAVTLLTQHCIADARASLGLFAEIWARYTDIVGGGRLSAVEPRPIPWSLNCLLSQRGIADEAPEEARGSAAPMMPSPAVGAPGDPEYARLRLTAPDTAVLAERGRRHGVSLHGVLSAGVLIAQAKTAGHEAVARLSYPVDLRDRVAPPIGVFDGTNVVGSAEFSATIRPDTALGPLAAAILRQLRADLASGAVHRSWLQVGSPADPAAGAAPAVGMTNWGAVPVFLTPPGLVVTDFRGAITNLVPGPAESLFYIVSSVGGRLSVELTVAGTQPVTGAEQMIGALAETLRGFAG